MHVIHLLLPVHDNQGQRFPAELFSHVRSELTEQFGGVTAYVRSPAVGLWKESEAGVNRDDVLMFEVVTRALDQEWWSSYRKRLEKQFRQQELLIWAVEAQRL
jgi:hypothetical protein